LSARNKTEIFIISHYGVDRRIARIAEALSNHCFGE
jgi:hypothetical protein